MSLEGLAPIVRSKETAQLPDTLEEPVVREHLRLAEDELAVVLPVYMSASLAYAERYTQRAIRGRSWEGETAELQELPAGYCARYFEEPVLRFVEWTDADDVVQAPSLSDFVQRFDPRSRLWTIEYTGALTTIKPDSRVLLRWDTAITRNLEAITAARLMMVGHFSENTEAVTADGRPVEVPIGAHALLDTFAEAPL